MKKYIIAAAITAAGVCALYAQTAPAAEKAAPAVKVEKIVTAASVVNREPVNEASAFDNATAQVYTWTKITAQQVPAKIKHVYYFNGEKVREIELTISSSPYRVWSAKNVRPGKWKVEVTDEAGTVLAATEFTVSDAKAAAAPAKPAEPAK